MMKYYFFLILTAFQFYQAAAQKDIPAYSILTIPNDLFIDSHSIIRSSKSTFEISGNETAILKVKQVLTVLGTEGEKHNFLKIHYDQFSSIVSLSGNLFDKKGSFLRKLKKSEIQDKSAIPGFSMYEDSRVKEVNLKHTEYPYTVEYEYQLSTNDLLHYPEWYPLENPNQSVEHSAFEVISSSKDELRYKEKNIVSPVNKSNVGGKNKYEWELKNYHAYSMEPLMAINGSIFPHVLIAPGNFKYGELSGNNQTWLTLGKFFHQLNEVRNDLPEEVINEISSLTIEAKENKEKVKIVYDYLLQHTRYVSVQLGLGSLQALTPKFVYENGYGDCKALCYYAQSILEAIDIPSVYTLVNAGYDKPDIDYDFPMDQFNHVILCVPNKGDTIWMECTDPNLPFGYLGSHTMDRHVLFITPEGGQIGKTPYFKSNDNLQMINAEVILFENGSAESNMSIAFNNLHFEKEMPLIYASLEEQKKHIYSTLNLADFEVTKLQYFQNSDEEAQCHESLELTIPRFSNMDGELIYFQPNVFNKLKKADRPNIIRKFPFECRFPESEVDSLVFKLPQNYRIENWPDKVSIDSDFGSFSMVIRQTENGLTFIRQLSLKQGVFESDKYTSYLNFLDRIYEADRIKLTLMKQK